MKISNSQLYDEDYLQNLKNAENSSQRPLNYRNLYGAGSGKYLETIEKKDKVDKSIRYFSKNQLYNRDGRYKNGTGDYKYITTINSFENSSYTSMTGDKVRGVINPAAGAPIRLQAPDGFKGYIQCLTKNMVLPGNPDRNIVYLASAPNDIANNLQVETASDNAVGRSQGFNFFSNVGTRQVTFSFDVFADYLPEPYNNVLSYCESLLQMNYPTYSSNVVNSPTVRFEYGGLHIIGIPTITCNFGNTIKKKNIDKATISVSITETESIVDGKVIL